MPWVSMSHPARRKSGFKAYHAVIILLFITIGSALAAFFWLGTVEEHVLYKDISIEKVEYDKITGAMHINLANGLNTAVPVKSSGAANERTVITIYPAGGGGDIGCDFVPLASLDCSGACDGKIASRARATISLGADRTKCTLPKGVKDYYINIFFGMRAPVSKAFSI